MSGYSRAEQILPSTTWKATATSPRVEYTLAPLGGSLSAHIAGIREWAYANMAGIEQPRTAFDARA